MSEIEKVLKDDEQEFWISDDERKRLIDMFTMIARVIESGDLWFNRPGIESNRQYAEFLRTMAKRFANMPVQSSN